MPGIFFPGQSQPGENGVIPSGFTTYLFLGHYSLYYLDYTDGETFWTLYAVPGNWYAINLANGRAGLSVPPPDGRWQGGSPGLGDEVIFVRRYAEDLFAARAQNASLHAANARKPYIQVPAGTPVPQPERKQPAALAAGRAVNAELQARRARGEVQ